MSETDLINRVKKIQRCDQAGKQAWIKYCEEAGDNIRDPTKHDPAFISHFCHHVYTPDANAQPVVDPFAECFKEAQKSSLNFKRCWAQFRECFANGKTDPARAPKEDLYAFLEFLGQQGLMAISTSGKGGKDTQNQMMAMKGEMMFMKGLQSGKGGCGDGGYGDSGYGGYGGNGCGYGDGGYGDNGMMGMQGASMGRDRGKGKDGGKKQTTSRPYSHGQSMGQGGGETSWDNQSGWNDHGGAKRGYSEAFGMMQMTQLAPGVNLVMPSYGGSQSWGGNQSWEQSSGGSSFKKPAHGGAKAALAEKIRAYLREGEAQRTCWFDFCDGGHGGVRDPYRHNEGALTEFVNTYGL